jgi:DNA-binding NarL/FixJ family response regulator
MGTPVQAGEPELVAPAKIARQLGISLGTVRKHLETICERLGVPSRTAAVTRAFPDQVAV